jgi:hypothetical protein
MQYRTSAVSIAALLIAGGAFAQSSSTALGPSGGSGPGGQSARSAPIPQTGPKLAGRPVGSLVTGRGDYARGSTVVFRFTVKNPSAVPIHYDFNTAQQFDITVTDPHGVEVWRWSTGRLFAQALTAVDLKTGESKTYTASWSTADVGRPLPTGTYAATATLTPTVRPAVRGGVLVSPDVDPNNVGLPTRGSAEAGAVVQVNVTPGVTATTKFTLTGS